LSPETNIRAAVPGDEAALALLGSATFLETYADKVRGGDIVAHCAVKHSATVYAAWLRDERCRIWAAETATGALVGYLVLTPATLPDGKAHPDDLEIQRIYVLSRVQAGGVGYRLMQGALAEAVRLGARQVVLGVLKKNTQAVAFYRRQGFSEIGARRFQVGEAVFDDYVLGRRCPFG
jgi:ribosomal protein S18 acetylase RimI-like enzyme